MPPPLSCAVRDAIAAARAPSLAVARQWRAGAAYRRLVDAFAGVQDLVAADAAAAALLADRGWLDELLAPLVGALAADPFHEPPLRASRDALRAGAVLFHAPAVSITASVLDHRAPQARRLPASVVVAGRVSHIAYVRAGDATLSRWRADRVAPDWSAAAAMPVRPLPALTLRDGLVLRHDGRTDAALLTGATGDVATLTITIRHGQSPLMREYARSDGALLRVATLDDHAARTGMLLSFLRTSGRVDAGDRFAAASRDPAFFLRWDAMREWLALDAAAAAPRLAEMAADDPNGEVRAAAAAMLPRVRAALDERVACRA